VTNTSNLSDEVNTESDYKEIPFPLSRTFTWKSGMNKISFTIDYNKIIEQLKIYNSNQEWRNKNGI
jgi:hypothetical protein